MLVGNGESQLPAPHRDYAGASIHAPVRFLHPPLSFRTARFPRSGWKRRHILVEPARHAVSSSDGAHTLAASQFAPRLVWFGWHSAFPDTEFRTGLPLQTVSAQGSFAPEALPSFLANTSSCANPGASRLHFVPGTYRRRPCRLHHPRLVIGTVPLWTAFLSWSAAPPIPAVRRVHITSSSPTTSAFALLCGARLPQVSHQTASRGRKFSIRQAFLYVAALQFACPPNRSAPLPGA